MVSKALSNTVVEVFGVRGSKFVIVVHLISLELNFQVNIIAVEVIVLQVLQKLWLLFVEGNLEWGKCFGGDNPCGNARAEVLGVEGSKRYIFPDLHVTGGPIVQ